MWGKNKNAQIRKQNNTRNKSKKETGYYDITTQTFSAKYFLSTEMHLHKISSQDFL